MDGSLQLDFYLFAISYINSSWQLKLYLVYNILWFVANWGYKWEVLEISNSLELVCMRNDDNFVNLKVQEP